MDHSTLWKILKVWEYQATLPVSQETYIQDRKQQLELDMEHWTDSKLGKEYIKAVSCHAAHFTSMQSISCIMPDWMIHKLESIAGRNINSPRFADDTTLMADSEEELKSLLMKVKEESDKVS